MLVITCVPQVGDLPVGQVPRRCPDGSRFRVSCIIAHLLPHPASAGGALCHTRCRNIIADEILAYDVCRAVPCHGVLRVTSYARRRIVGERTIKAGPELAPSGQERPRPPLAPSQMRCKEENGPIDPLDPSLGG